MFTIQANTVFSIAVLQFRVNIYFLNISREAEWGCVLELEISSLQLFPTKFVHWAKVDFGFVYSKQRTLKLSMTWTNFSSEVGYIHLPLLSRVACLLVLVA